MAEVTPAPDEKVEVPPTDEKVIKTLNYYKTLKFNMKTFILARFCYVFYSFFDIV